MWMVDLYVIGFYQGSSLLGKMNVKIGNYKMLVKLEYGGVEVSIKFLGNLEVVLVLFWRFKEDLLKVLIKLGFEG